jgi:hypothetical protein
MQDGWCVTEFNSLLVTVPSDLIYCYYRVCIWAFGPLDILRLDFDASYGTDTTLKLVNVIIDASAGYVPILGNIVDFAFKSNLANLGILENHLRRTPK